MRSPPGRSSRRAHCARRCTSCRPPSFPTSPPPTSSRNADGRSGWESTWRVLRAAVPDEPVTSAELFELGHRVLGTSDRWTVAFAYRALPFVRLAPVGEWPHTKPPPFALWREPLPEPRESAIRVVRRYLAAYGPATRDDITQFTSFKVRQIVPALEGLPTLTDEQGRTLYDVRGAPRAAGDVPAPVRFLPAFDSIILAHRDRSRIVPTEYLDAVFNKRQRDDEEHVHRRRVRRRRVASRTYGGSCSSRSPRCRRACGAKWTPKATGCSPGISARRRRASGRARARRAGRRGRPGPKPVHAVRRGRSPAA